MIDIKQKNQNIQFYGRNIEIRKAQQILHKIKSDYPASSSYIADLLRYKQDLKLKFPERVINLSDAILESYMNDRIGAKLTNDKVGKLRYLQKHYLNDDYHYCDSLVWGIEKFRVMNCKENSELAFLIAKINGYKNAHCVSLSRMLPDSTFADIGHSVLLINQELPKNIEKINKFYIEDINDFSVIQPSRKAIVVDPLFGIVDYWDNAVQYYKTIFPQIIKSGELWAGVREMIINTSRDINNLKESQPKLIIHSKEGENKQSFLNRIIIYLHRRFKKLEG